MEIGHELQQESIDLLTGVHGDWLAGWNPRVRQEWNKMPSLKESECNIVTGII